MLVLSRKSGERIVIGEGIVVEIKRIAGNRVTLGLVAPRGMRILRGELQEAASAFRESGREAPHEAEATSEAACNCLRSSAAEDEPLRTSPQLAVASA